MKTSDRRSLWGRILTIAGGIGILAGAVDPMEGSWVILPGGLLLLLGGLLCREQPRVMTYRLWAAGLITAGVGALWASSMIGGFGGDTGHSMWWGLVVLPYPVGWCMAVCGPGSPRWLTVAGAVAGLWFVAIAVVVVVRNHPGVPISPWPAIVIGATGLAALIGCVLRLRGLRCRRT